MRKSNKTDLSKNPTPKEIYMDYASSAEPNPSSIHAQGVLWKKKLESAREQASMVLGARAHQVIFTSGGTESNNLALLGTVERWRLENLKKLHIITTNIEHPSVLETCKMLEKKGLIELSIVPVESNGIVDPKKIKKEIKDNTVLVSVMYANNEIGTIQPIKEIAKEIRHFKKIGKNNSSRHGYFSTEKFLELAPTRSLVPEKLLFPILHIDAVQAANYLDLNVERLGVDLMSLSGSKIEDSGKAGLLFVRDVEIISSVFAGGDQERGLRPGTENVEDIARFAKALEFTQKIKEKENKRLLSVRTYFLDKLTRLSQDLNLEICVNGEIKERLPNNINITIPNIPSELLVIELSARGIYVSSKSACKSGDGKVSHVIEAINPDIKETDGSLRFSFGRSTSQKDVTYTLKTLKSILIKLKRWYGEKNLK